MVADKWIKNMYSKIDAICLKEISSHLANNNLKDWIDSWQADFKRTVREVNDCYGESDGWIKVSEELPNEEDPVQLLVYNDKGDYISIYVEPGWRISGTRERGKICEKSIWIAGNELVDGEVVGWKPMTNPLDLKTLKELGFIK